MICTHNRRSGKLGYLMMAAIIATAIPVTVFAVYVSNSDRGLQDPVTTRQDVGRAKKENPKTNADKKMDTKSKDLKIATFGAGCFWCVESDFEHVDGVISAESGYTGGTTDNPTYKNHMKAMHLEAVKIVYDSDKVNFETLLNIFWRSVDPTDAGGQFCDRGNSYSTAVFAVDASQMKIALASKKMINEAGIIDQPIITPIREAAPFYPAEGYHQDYYNLNPNQPYCKFVIDPKVQKMKKQFKDKLK